MFGKSKDGMNYDERIDKLDYLEFKIDMVKAALKHIEKKRLRVNKFVDHEEKEIDAAIFVLRSKKNQFEDEFLSTAQTFYR